MRQIIDNSPQLANRTAHINRYFCDQFKKLLDLIFSKNKSELNSKFQYKNHIYIKVTNSRFKSELILSARISTVFNLATKQLMQYKLNFMLFYKFKQVKIVFL
jgi:hypothetical protein